MIKNRGLEEEKRKGGKERKRVEETELKRWSRKIERERRKEVRKRQEMRR